MAQSKTNHGLGTLLRRLQELTDGELESVYLSQGLDYLPRYTPIIKVLTKESGLTLRQIAAFAGVSQPAVSQTISKMLAAGLVMVSIGKDARERQVRLTESAENLLPKLHVIWEASDVAARSLEHDIGRALHKTLTDAISALEARSFGARLHEALEKSQGKADKVT